MTPAASGPERACTERLGIFGGSFNPPHNGHLALARAVQSAHALDRVIFMPAGAPPHKHPGELASAADRLEMVRLAIDGHEGFEVSDAELRREGTTYTVDTLEECRRLYPKAELFFLIGADSLVDLPGWRSPKRILELARVVAVNRPGHEGSPTAERFSGIAAETLERLRRDCVEMPASALESRELRRRIRQSGAGSPALAGALAEGVRHYIERRGLYRQD